MSEQITESALRACELAQAVGFSFGDVPDDPAESEHLNADGAWEYHFETAPEWGFVAAGPVDAPIETTYDGWPVTVSPYHWSVFKDETPVSVFSPADGTIVGTGAIEDTMLRAFQYEIDCVGGDER